MFTFFSSGFNKFWALLTAILLTVTINAENPPGVPDGAVLVTSHTYMLDQALTRGQGVTTDGQYFYFSGNLFLNKTDMQTNKTLVKNVMAIPPQLLLLGDNHIGGISYYNKTIYAAIEDSKVWKYPIVALFDSATLKFTGRYSILSAELQKNGVPWIAVDGENGYLYSAQRDNSPALIVYDLQTLTFVKTVPLSMTVDKIQGAEMYKGILYAATNDATQAVYAINPVTGEAHKYFDRNLVSGSEGEGMTVLETADGAVFHTLDLSPIFINAYFRHYAPVK